MVPNMNQQPQDDIDKPRQALSRSRSIIQGHEEEEHVLNGKAFEHRQSGKGKSKKKKRS